jgi:hypothetical protein
MIIGKSGERMGSCRRGADDCLEHDPADRTLTSPISRATASVCEFLRHPGRIPRSGSTGDSTMRRIVTAAAATAALAIVALGAAGAHAGSLGRPCTTAAESQYLSAGDLQARAEAQGYKVSRVKIAKACGEIYALDKTGAKVELFVDPTNGSVVGSK